MTPDPDTSAMALLRLALTSLREAQQTIVCLSAPSNPYPLTKRVEIDSGPPCSGVRKRVASKRVVLADVPLISSKKSLAVVPGRRKLWFLMYSQTGPKKNGRRAHSPKPPFYKIALLFPREEPNRNRKPEPSEPCFPRRSHPRTNSRLGGISWRTFRAIDPYIFFPW